MTGDYEEDTAEITFKLMIFMNVLPIISCRVVDFKEAHRKSRPPLTDGGYYYYYMVGVSDKELYVPYVDVIEYFELPSSPGEEAIRLKPEWEDFYIEWQLKQKRDWDRIARESLDRVRAAFGDECKL